MDFRGTVLSPNAVCSVIHWHEMVIRVPLQKPGAEQSQGQLSEPCGTDSNATGSLLGQWKGSKAGLEPWLCNPISVPILLSCSLTKGVQMHNRRALVPACYTQITPWHSCLTRKGVSSEFLGLYFQQS